MATLKLFSSKNTIVFWEIVKTTCSPGVALAVVLIFFAKNSCNFLNSTVAINQFQTFQPSCDLDSKSSSRRCDMAEVCCLLVEHHRLDDSLTLSYSPSYSSMMVSQTSEGAEHSCAGQCGISSSRSR
jgi:hypothetical protein